MMEKWPLQIELDFGQGPEFVTLKRAADDRYALYGDPSGHLHRIQRKVINGIYVYRRQQHEVH